MSNLSEQLLRGAHRIDEMQKEVLKTVQALKGVITLDDLLTRGYQVIEINTDKGVRWEIFAHKTSVIIRCRIFTAALDTYDYEIAPGNLIGLQNVQLICESLRPFIRRLCENNPWVLKNIEPFLRAAEL